MTEKNNYIFEQIKDKKDDDRVTINDLLPDYVANNLDIKNYMNGVANHFFQKPYEEPISGFIGSKNVSYNKDDYYISEVTKKREQYQLSQFMVSKDDKGNIDNFMSYRNIVNEMKYQGSFTENENRLWSCEIWSWTPCINPDMFINYNNYFWCERGCPAITVEEQTNVITDIIGKEKYTLPESEIELQSGMRIYITNDENTEYNNHYYVVENVGKAIKLINDDAYEEDWEKMTDSEKEESATPDYIVMERGSIEGSQWSYKNRWFNRKYFKGVSLVGYKYHQANRPIIQYVADIQLANFGAKARSPIDLYWEGSYNDINGKSNTLATAYIDDVQVQDGMRILITNDPNETFNNKIYVVSGIATSGLIMLSVDTTGLSGNSNSLENECVRIKSGKKYKNKVFYYKNGKWIPGQEKTEKNQYPLFELYDIDHIPLSNDVIYEDCKLTDSYGTEDYRGSKLFSFKVDESAPEDPILGFRAAIESSNNFIFENNIYTDKITYKLNYKDTELKTLKHYRINTSLDESYYVTDWQKSLSDSRQMINKEWIIRAKKSNIGLDIIPYTFDIDVNPDSETNGRENILVYLNGKKLSRNVNYEVGDKKVKIDSDNTTINENDKLSIKVFSSTVDKLTDDSYYDVPLNLSANGLNNDIETISYNDVFSHFISIITNQANLTGSPYGENNFNSTARVLSYGTEIIQHTGSLLRLMLLNDMNYLHVRDVINDIKNDYLRFKTKIYTKISQLILDDKFNEKSDYKEVVLAALNAVNVGKDKSFPYYNNGVINDESYIPASPSYLGLYKLFLPQKVYVDTLSEPKWMILGHDGSLNDMFGDYRDDIILTYEKMIYDSVLTKFKDEPLVYDYSTIYPGKFRKSEYSLNEVNEILQPLFEVWNSNEDYDYKTNISYSPEDPFTWNWSSVNDIDNEKLPGHWRGIYQYYFDTDTPHTTPWKMLGFGEKPSYWDSTYGEAPYTSQNYQMWKDLEDGYIRGGNSKGYYENYKRPGLMNIIPVDDEGNLLDPYTCHIAKMKPSGINAAKDFKFGDIAPVEWLWRNSSYFPFDLQTLCYLLKPSYWMEMTWDTEHLTRLYPGKSYTKIINSVTYSVPKITDNYVHNEIINNVRIKCIGSQQWFSDELVKNGINITDYLGKYLRNINVQLGYASGSYYRSDMIEVSSDNFGLIPPDNIHIQLGKSTATKTVSYSSLNIGWTGKGYRVFGYDVTDPYFMCYWPDETKEMKKITIGDYSVVSYNVFQTEPIKVPYDTLFTNVQDCYSFIRGYGKYLEKQGFIFNDYISDSKEISNWTTSANQFVSWINEGLEEGDAINLNPASNRLIFSYDLGIPDKLNVKTKCYWNLWDINSTMLDKDDIKVLRLDNITNIEIKNDRFWGLCKISLVEYEHVIIFDNETIFGDVIFDPLNNLHQKRLRINGTRTAYWNGTLYAPGYVLVGDDAVPNYSKLAEEIGNSYDITSVDSIDQFGSSAKKLTGFIQKDFMKEMLLDKKTMFSFYQGMIREKGTRSALSKLTRSRYLMKPDDFFIYELWMFKVGEFGSVGNNLIEEFNIKQKEIVQNPQLYRFTTIDDIEDKDDDSTVEIGFNDSRWIKKDSNRDVNKFNKITSTKGFLKTAGYCQVDDATFKVVNTSLLNTIYQGYDSEIKENDTVWVTFDENRGWNFYGLRKIASIDYFEFDEELDVISELKSSRLYLKDIIDNDYIVDGQEIIIKSDYDLIKPAYYGNQKIGIVDTDEEGNQFIRLEKAITTDDKESKDIIGDVYVFESLRFDNYDDLNSVNWASVNSLAYLDSMVLNNVSGIYDPHSLMVKNDCDKKRWSVFKFNEGYRWELFRIETDKIDSNAFDRLYIYDKKSGKTLSQIQVYDPIKLTIPGNAKKEIYYINDIDPANYNINQYNSKDVHLKNLWNSVQEGRLWWDVSKVKYVEYEQGDIYYRRNNWGKLAEGSEIAIYEWTKSSVLPSEWASYVESQKDNASEEYVPSGEPYTIVDESGNVFYKYVESSEYDESSDSFVTYYYFWVKNPSHTPNKKFRSLPGNQVAEILRSPMNQGIIYFAPIYSEYEDREWNNAFILANVGDIVTDDNAILQINYKLDPKNQGNVHKEWVTEREYADDEIHEIVWNKFKDSIIGLDSDNKVVPDYNLDESKRYGLQYRPRQTIFKDLYEARRSFVEILNELFGSQNLRSDINLWENIFTAEDPLPNESEYDYRVLNREERNILINSSESIATGARVLVEYDEGFDGKWTLWIYQGNGEWGEPAKSQLYKVAEYWDYKDWYNDDYGFNEFYSPSIEYATISDLLADTNHKEGDVVKILDDGTGKWVYQIYEDNEGQLIWSTVAAEKGTVEFNDKLYSKSYEEASIYDRIYYELATVIRILLGYFDGKLWNKKSLIINTTQEDTKIKLIYKENTYVSENSMVKLLDENEYYKVIVTRPDGYVPYVEEGLAQYDINKTVTLEKQEAAPMVTVSSNFEDSNIVIHTEYGEVYEANGSMSVTLPKGTLFKVNATKTGYTASVSGNTGWNALLVNTSIDVVFTIRKFTLVINAYENTNYPSNGNELSPNITITYYDPENGTSRVVTFTNTTVASLELGYGSSYNYIIENDGYATTSGEGTITNNANIMHVMPGGMMILRRPSIPASWEH